MDNWVISSWLWTTVFVYVVFACFWLLPFSSTRWFRHSGNKKKKLLCMMSFVLGFRFVFSVLFTATLTSRVSVYWRICSEIFLESWCGSETTQKSPTVTFSFMSFHVNFMKEAAPMYYRYLKGRYCHSSLFVRLNVIKVTQIFIASWHSRTDLWRWTAVSFPECRKELSERGRCQKTLTTKTTGRRVGKTTGGTNY